MPSLPRDVEPCILDPDPGETIMTNRLLQIAMGGSVVCLLLAVPGDAQTAGGGRIMQWKLEHSQKLLAGLALEDHAALAKHAEQLRILSLDASWQVLQTPEYARQSQQFRRTAATLKEAALQHNLDGATLAYVDLTMRCIDCHRYVRKETTAVSRTDTRDR
jgi:hypothetical protein